MSENTARLPCPHARPDWRMCPHCLGISHMGPATEVSFTITATSATMETSWTRANVFSTAANVAPYQVEARKRKRVELPDPHRTEVKREQRRKQMEDARRMAR